MGYMLLKEKASFMSLVIICAVFSIYLINPVSAEDTAPDTSENLGCCEKTNSGESCRYTNVEDCNSEGYNVGNFQRCEDSAFCKPGCCISPDGGCSKQVSKATCESAGDGYTWNQDATCNIEKCQKGCCVLGGVECKYTTAKRCSGITADFEGLELDFRNGVGSEQECTDICKQQDDGCCVKATGECTRTKRGMCGLSDGTGSDGFYKDVFCSNENLQNACDPKCKPEAKMGCVEGLEDVYWFDSCGNREGVVTEPIAVGDAPNGDCDYARGTLCSGADANHDTAYCKSVNCKEVKNYEQISYDGDGAVGTATIPVKYNGESWCIYDSKPGPGSDTVGSRHWRHICINGEEVVEPCKDYREEMCVQMDIENVPSGAALYMESACLPNNAATCSLDCNTAREAEDAAEKEAAMKHDKKCCQSTKRNCVWQITNEETEEGVCLAYVGAGLNFGGDDEGNVDEEAKQICNIWNTDEDADWAENAFEFIDAKGNRQWDCIGRCELYNLEYLQTNNQLCNSAGDCGAKYNYLGEYSKDGTYRAWEKDPTSSTDKKELKKEDLKEEATFEYLLANVGKGLYKGKEDYNEIKSQQLSASPGMEYTDANYAGFVSAWFFTASLISVIVATDIAMMATGAGFTLFMGLTEATTVVATFTQTAAAAAQAVTAATEAAATAAELGVATELMTAEVLALGAEAATAEAAALSAAIPIAGWVVSAILLVITAILMGIMYSAGEETRAVTTTCEPWVAPVGGSDCSRCDTEEPMHPCSEYRCNSLGQNCKFIPENEGTTKGSCYDEDPNDVTRPEIKPWYADDGSDKYPLAVWKRERTSEGPQRVEVHAEYPINPLPSSNKYNSGYEITEKLPSFSTIEFGIRTDNKPAQCKYSTEFSPDMTFATAGNWFGDNYFSKEHNMTIYGLLPNKTYEYYVICRAANGYPKEDERVPPFKISFQTGEGPDLEPPFVVGADPANGGYVKAGDSASVILMIDEVSPFRCKMAKADLDFNMMDINVSCLGRSGEGIRGGYGLCGVELGEMKQGPNTYYFRCKDMPEAGTPSNTMEESYVYTVMQSEPLEITSLSPPNGTIYYTNNITILATTAKGAFGGRARCSYKERVWNFGDYFFDTNSTQHTQTLSNLIKSPYSLLVECYDEVGNTATSGTIFVVAADTMPPNVIALYKDASGLHLTLDEKASCEYSNTKFSYGTGTSASTDSETATFPATLSKYHIICRDKFGNTMPEIIVKTEI